MAKKIWAITVLAILGVIVAGLWKAGGSSLTIGQKAKIEEAYRMHIFSLFDESELSEAARVCEEYPIVWFDENGGKRDYGVYRYFGTYGDCIVLLRYGKSWTTATMPWGEKIEEPPFRIPGLSRSIYSPVAFSNQDPNYPTQKYDSNHTPLHPLFGLYEVRWLTDEQLDQLMDDLENWLAEGNY